MTKRTIRQLLAGPAPQLKGLRGMIAGMGESGQGAAELLLHEEAVVWAYDADPKKLEPWRDRCARVLSGELKPMEGIDFCVVSPGFPPFGPFFDWLRQQDIPLLGEMELAYRFLQRPILAITGTNGKTTVTGMTAHILNHCGYKAEEVGNVGYPVAKTAIVERAGTNPLVMEVSSYQCETFEEFHAQVAVITNLAPDHLDRYPSEREYYEVKFQIAKNQAPNEALWLGPRIEGECPAWVPSRKRSFALNELGSDGLFFADGTVIHRDGVMEERLLQPSLENYPSQQVLNVLAAAGAAVSFGVPLAEALHTLESYQPLPHRLEFVADVNGIRCYNDSKATNVHAVQAALTSLPGPIRLIAGGRAKGDSLDPLEPLIREKVRAIYLIGEAADEFAQAWRSLTEVHVVKTLEEAVDRGLRDGHPGDILLLSPACASWDMFANYKERGNLFKQAVKEWKA